MFSWFKNPILNAHFLQNDLSKILTQLLQSDVSEMPLLVLVYFQTDAIQQVEDTIRSILAMQVPIGK